MFEKLNLTAAPKTSRATAFAFPLTIAFVQTLTDEGYRLSYTALRNAAHDLGEDASNQKPAQRGAFLAKKLPGHLQPSVSRKNGTYHEKVLTAWTVDVDRAELATRPVVTKDDLDGFLSVWQEATEAEAECGEDEDETVSEG